MSVGNKVCRCSGHRVEGEGHKGWRQLKNNADYRYKHIHFPGTSPSEYNHSANRKHAIQLRDQWLFKRVLKWRYSYGMIERRDVSARVQKYNYGQGRRCQYRPRCHCELGNVIPIIVVVGYAS